VAGGGAGGTGGTGTTLIDDPLRELPLGTDLAEVGIYPALPSIDTAHPRAFYYEPKHPLWSNGLGKQRFMVLPEGAAVDTAVRDAWTFPVGTLFFKTFTYQDAQGQAVPVETRLIRRELAEGEIYEQWRFYVFEWNQEATAATSIDIFERTPRQAMVGGEVITHNIPQETDCWNCHVGNAVPIIGFDELRLNSALEGQADLQLQQAIAAGHLSAPPTEPWVEITDPDPMTQDVLRYFAANCVHCHNGLPPQEPGARYQDLNLHWTADILQQTVGIPATTIMFEANRITAGDPSQSVLFLAVSRENPEVQIMPLVGVDVPDPAGIELLRQWITGLEAPP
jgi:hypothetical protein